MNKRKSKKIFLGLSILSFLVSGITATSIFWSFNKNFSDYEKIYTELKKARDLVNSPNYKKSADDILKNPNYKTFSRENVADINEALSKIIVQIDKEIKVYISKINSTSKKAKLNTDLLNSQNSIDAKRKIKDNALKLIDIELVKDINLEKIEKFKKLIENIKNSTKKAEFEKKLPFIKSINDIELLISDVEKELKKQSINDYISAKKKTLIAKINASTLNKEEKKKLLELFKDLKTTSTLFDNEIIINYEILKAALKKQAANRIELLENDNFKKIIKNSFGKAKTIKDYYDILLELTNMNSEE
ncbi:hypothetical protein NW062_00680 [Mycoplasmopsis cynos]|nr:hypothetical protein NW062_00680 [Mycoplasmopsis cynos]